MCAVQRKSSARAGFHLTLTGSASAGLRLACAATIVELRQSTKIVLRRADVAALELSIPGWAEIAAAPDNRGFLRHGVKRAKSHIRPELKLPYEEHVRALPAEYTGNLLLWGTRNSMQNLLLPAYHAERDPKLLRRVDEPWRCSIYHALVRHGDGRIAIEAVRFSSKGGIEPDGIELRADDGKWRAQEDVVWAVVGQPLVWDGALPPIGSLAAMTYDLRHVWKLAWEPHQSCLREARIHEKLMHEFMAHLSAATETRAAILSDIAREHHLQIEDGYLHSSLGLDARGNLILLARHGSLTEIGRELSEAGARRAILLDNGGSVGYAIFKVEAPAEAGTSTDLSGIRTAVRAVGEIPGVRISAPTFIGNGSYFRPKGHALLAARLTVDPAAAQASRPTRIDLEAIAGTDEPAGSTLLDDVLIDLEAHAQVRVDLLFDDPHGLTRVGMPIYDLVPAAHSPSPHILAVLIQNHAVLFGTKRVYIEAGQAFVDAVNHVFASRFNVRDPGTGIQSGAMSDYLSVYNDPEPFSIEMARTGLSAAIDLALNRAPDAAPAACASEDGMSRGDAISLGIDIGDSTLKLVVLRGGKTVSSHRLPTRPGPGGGLMSSQYLLQEIQTGAQRVLERASLRLEDVQCVGVAWPGAVKDGYIAASSLLLRSMDDLRVSARLCPDKFEWIRDMAAHIRAHLGIEAPVYLINDGEVIAHCAARERGLRSTVLVQLGSSIAGGYIDARGRSDYLAEFGRMVIDLSREAPVQSYTGIRGRARELASSAALVRDLVAGGVTDFKGELINRQNAGEIANAILQESRQLPEQAIVRAALQRLGRNLGHFIVALSDSLPMKRVMLSGGLIADRSKAGDLILESMSALLPEPGQRRIEVEIGAENDRCHGARAAAMYAIVRQHEALARA